MSLLEDLTRVSKLPNFEGADAVRYTNGNIRSSFGYTTWATALINRINNNNMDEVKQLCRKAETGIYIIGGCCMAQHTEEAHSDTRFEVYVTYREKDGFEYVALTYATGHTIGNQKNAPEDIGVAILKTPNINDAIKFLYDRVDTYKDTYVDKSKMKELIGSF